MNSEIKGCPLAVMDEMERLSWYSGANDPNNAEAIARNRRAKEARAKVAELVEAAKAYQESVAAYRLKRNAVRLDAMSEANSRLRVALARFGVSP